VTDSHDLDDVTVIVTHDVMTS